MIFSPILIVELQEKGKLTRNPASVRCLMHCCGISTTYSKKPLEANFLKKEIWGIYYPAHVLGEYAAAKLLQSCPTLCNPIDSSPPGSPVPGILQARTTEWVAISFSSAWKWKVKVKSLSHVRLPVTPMSDPMDCSLPGFPIHGIFQARVLEWGAIAFSTLYTTTCKINSF